MQEFDPPIRMERGEGTGKRVIFADFAIVKYATLTTWLHREGVGTEAVTDPPKFLAKIAEEEFDVAVVNLLLGGLGPFEMIQQVRSTSKNKEIKIIVISRQVQKVNIQNTIRAGSNDFVAEPFENDNLYHRILYHLSPKRTMDPQGYQAKALDDFKHWQYVNLLLESTELLSRTERTKEHTTFWEILKRVAKETGSNRTSLVITEAETNTGVVLASSDDPNFYDFPIALDKYPEILHVMYSGQFVLIDDVAHNQLTQKISAAVKTINIGSLMVFPIQFQNEVIGVLTIRRPEAKEMPSPDVLRVIQAIANTTAAHSNVKALLRKIYRTQPAKAS